MKNDEVRIALIRELRSEKSRVTELEESFQAHVRNHPEMLTIQEAIREAKKKQRAIVEMLKVFY